LNQIIALVVSYKIGIPWDIPANEVSIKGRSLMKHLTLTWKYDGKHDWLRALVHSKNHRSANLFKLHTKLVFLDTSQLLRPWLKAEAILNIDP
jgi:hypothetical protein